jgi:hypothetical protein
VGNSALEADGRPCGGGGGSVEVAKVLGYGEAGGGSGFVAKAFDRDGGSLEDPSVEWGGAASEEGFDLVSGAKGGPAAAGALDGEPLGEGFGSAAFSAEGDGAEGEGGVAFPYLSGVAGGGESEGLEVGRVLGGGTPSGADVGERELPLVAVVEDKACALEEGHPTGGGRWRVRRPLFGRSGIGRHGGRVGVVPVVGGAVVRRGVGGGRRLGGLRVGSRGRGARGGGGGGGVGWCAGPN